MALLQGRAHLYEGGDPEALRCRCARCTPPGPSWCSRAGSLRPEVSPGRLMLISDHINLSGTNILTGPNDEELGRAFRACATPTTLSCGPSSARLLGIDLAEGVYLAVAGRASRPRPRSRVRPAGADAVGMSTVHETVAARHCGMRVAAISAITNLAEGLGDQALSHEQTLADVARAPSTWPRCSRVSSSGLGLRHARPGADPREARRNELSEEQIGFLVEETTDGSVTDAQVGALAMAIVLRGMSATERVALTGAMTHSGDVLDWSDAGLDGPVLDKHSTGGVGDKVSLLLAPAVAACGGAVPMISGRGWATGGTLDKLESIPGYTTLDPRAFAPRWRASAAPSWARPPSSLPPTVGCTPSATPPARWSRYRCSWLRSCRKLAAGLGALVMDVKVGSGAFLPSRAAASELALSIVEVARGNGLPTSALLTDMDRVLGRSAGNALEVRESIDHLTGAARDERLREVTLALSAELLRLGSRDGRGVGARPPSAPWRVVPPRSGCRDGRRVGGPADLLENLDRHLLAAPVTLAAEAAEAGVVTSVDVRRVGVVVVALGGGRTRESDPVDHSVGLAEVAAPGERWGRARGCSR